MKCLFEIYKKLFSSDKNLTFDYIHPLQNIVYFNDDITFRAQSVLYNSNMEMFDFQMSEDTMRILQWNELLRRALTYELWKLTWLERTKFNVETDIDVWIKEEQRFYVDQKWKSKLEHGYYTVWFQPYCFIRKERKEIDEFFISIKIYEVYKV